MIEEIWKPVVGFDDYEVSNLGRVRSHKSKLPRILKPRAQKSGHLQLWLRSGGKTIAVGVHRITLIAFEGNPPEGMNCLHKDDDPSNNCLTNLFWGTQSDNIKQMIKNGRRTQPNPPYRIGLEASQSKLTKEQIIAIRDDTRTCLALSKIYNVSPMTISRCRNLQTYINV